MEIKKHFDLENMEKKMIENHYFFMTGLIPYLPTMQRVPDLKNTTAVYSDVDDNTFNFVLKTHFTLENAQESIQEVMTFYNTRHVSFAWYIYSEDTPANLFLLLKEAGIVHKETNVAMVIDIQNIIIKESSSLEFKRAQTAQELKDFDAINQSVGESPLWERIFKSLPAQVFEDNFPIQYYVGYLNGEPVTTGVLVFYAGVAGIYHIATHPTHQRKGFAKAMMTHLFQRAKKQDFSIILLQATEEGQYLYDKLGFEPFSYVHEYNWNPQKSGEQPCQSVH